METRFVELTSIKPDNKINSRQADRKAGIKELAFSIKYHGLMLPLAVRPNGADSYTIIDGHRRYEALMMILKENSNADILGQVPVLVHDADDKAAAEGSLVANIFRLPLHPADQYEAFAALINKGVDEKQIATRFSLHIKDVRKRLALGSVIPSFMKKYRNDEIGIEEMELLASCSPETQDRVFKEIGKFGQVNFYQIRELIKNRIAGDSALAARIGRTAYLEAGGSIESDLFNDKEWWTTPEVYNTFRDKVIENIKADLLADGWSWALLRSEVKDFYSLTQLEQKLLPTEKQQKKLDEAQAVADAAEQEYNAASEEEDTDSLYDKLQEAQVAVDNIEAGIKREWTAEQKAISGVIIHDDTLALDYARLTYTMKRKIDMAGAANEETDEADSKPKTLEAYSQAVRATLHEALTGAIQLTIEENPQLAKALLVAEMAATFPGALDIRGRGLARTSKSPKEITELSKMKLAKAVETVLAMTPTKVDNLLAWLIAGRLEVINIPANHQLFKLKAMEKTNLYRTWKPDEEFLSRLSSAEIHDAMKQAKAPAIKQGLKKAELVKLAAKALTAAKWWPKIIKI